MTPSLFPPWGGRALHPSPEATSLAGMGEAQSTARRGVRGKGRRQVGPGPAVTWDPPRSQLKSQWD